MRWPWVSRAQYEAMFDAVVRERAALTATRAAGDEAIRVANARYDALLEKYHALRVSGANAPEPEKAVPPPKRPPAIVYRAMRAISPRDDATFAANWRLWEENQEECDKDPVAFSERIKRGRMTPEPQPRAD